MLNKRNIFLLSYLPLFLTACNLSHLSRNQYGNFINQKISAPFYQMIGQDAAKELSILHPPAQTRLKLMQALNDNFGQLFISQLRSYGYAIQEYNPNEKKLEYPPLLDTNFDAALETVPNLRPISLPLRYVLDKASGTNLYIITIQIGNEQLARSYFQQNQTIYPAGSWAHKE